MPFISFSFIDFFNLPMQFANMPLGMGARIGLKEIEILSLDT